MRYGEPFAYYDRGSSSWKTLSASLDFSDMFSGDWPKSGGMKPDGSCYQLPPLVPPTVANDGSVSPLLPTSDAGGFNDGENPEAWLERRATLKAQRINGNGMGTPLAMAIRLLPTARVSDSTGPGLHGDGGPDLRTAVALLPTAMARDWKDGSPAQVPTNALLGRAVWMRNSTGDPTGLPSGDGSASWDDRLPLEWTNGDD
jgi:hypothetical protein